MIAFENTLTPEQARFQQARAYVGTTIEMVAGPDDLTADRGLLKYFRAGDAWTERAAVVDFERNGRFLIPLSMLFLPICDEVVRKTEAFILTRSSPRERCWMGVSFRASDDVRNDASNAKSAYF